MDGGISSREGIGGGGNPAHGSRNTEIWSPREEKGAEVTLHMGTET
jgi:hypothetical protein